MNILNTIVAQKRIEVARLPAGPISARDLRDVAQKVFARDRMYVATIGTLTARGRLSLREMLQRG